jgi:4-hydroxy-tetrahydrodipicolinate synthase
LTTHNLEGVFAAAVTPISADHSPDREAIPLLLDFLAHRGCQGALLLGTTGEGPSFSPDQRREVFQAAVAIRQVHPDFILLAGTGTSSLEETVQLTRLAFDLGMDGVVVLPPFYFRNASQQGLFSWFEQVILRAVPHEGALLGYHFPNVAGIGFSLDLLQRLKDAFPDQFTGLKDSSSDAEFSEQLGRIFGKSLKVFTGNDRLFSTALANQASGCITAMTNLISPDLAILWEAHQAGREDLQTQRRVNAARTVFERFPPAPALIKALLSQRHGLPRWSVCPPLMPIGAEGEAEAMDAMDMIYN